LMRWLVLKIVLREMKMERQFPSRPMRRRFLHADHLSARQ